jgi:hypothetical protein
VAGKRGSRRKTRNIEIDLTEFGNIVEATQDRALSEQERKVLRDAKEILARLVPSPNTETGDAVLGEQDHSGDQGTSKSGNSKKGGSGRRPRSDFVDPEVVENKHQELKAGQICPCGCGRLYALKRPLHHRHFTGQAALRVTLFESEQLRCSTCGTVYTAPLPDGVGPDSYAPSAKSTIAYAISVACQDPTLKSRFHRGLTRLRPWSPWPDNPQGSEGNESQTTADRFCADLKGRVSLRIQCRL